MGLSESASFTNPVMEIGVTVCHIANATLSLLFFEKENFK